MNIPPRTGEIAADRDRVASPHGAALVARRDTPFDSAAADLSNVVPFARPRRTPSHETPPLTAAAQDRAAAPMPLTSMKLQAAVLAASLALHGVILAAFLQQPKPLASIGIEAITVETVLGGHTAAGLATTVAEQEVQPTSLAQEERRNQQAVEVHATTAALQDVPVAAQEAAPDVQIDPDRPPVEAAVAETSNQVAAIETPEAQVPDALPPVAQPETSDAVVTPPEPQKQQSKAQPKSKTPAMIKARERTRIAAPTAKKATQKKRAAAVSPNASSGIGRGRSDNSANYDGRVAAHLARHKQYPADARNAGSQGVASVSFTIDGGGRVTSVRLARGSGIASIDREVQAMVRRASPFPAPPDGRGRSFTVPVRFNLR
ncbi:MAG: TonB family protein [Xanthobacteraceae bacterium]